ncbi:MAG: hypothetical protein IPO04_09430 [Cytophagaceae bacterium]|nr:hypothetical protein [Cytophagaceae bacterium]
MSNNLKTPLNQAQMMVLQVVNEQYNETDLAELRQLLIDFNHKKMQKTLIKLLKKKLILFKISKKF